MTYGPPIEHLTRRLAECPSEFLAEGAVVAAVVSDLLEDLGASSRLTDAEARTWQPQRRGDKRNLLRLTLVACWLCHDPWLVAERRFAAGAKAWITRALEPLSEVVSADLFVSDPDRREELTRSLLSALDLLSPGETALEAADRHKALDSVARAQVIRDTRDKQQRARELRAQMEAERAREAAARYSSE